METPTTATNGSTRQRSPVRADDGGCSSIGGADNSNCGDDSSTSHYGDALDEILGSSPEGHSQSVLSSIGVSADAMGIGTGSDDVGYGSVSLLAGANGSSRLDVLGDNADAKDPEKRASAASGTTPAPDLVPATPPSTASTATSGTAVVDSETFAMPTSDKPTKLPPQPRVLDPELAGIEDNHPPHHNGGGSDNNSNNDDRLDINIDDLLTQLDDVEAEYETKLHNVNTSLHEKDAVIGALGRQLAEMRDASAALENGLEVSEQTSEQLRSELDVANGAVKELRAEMDNLILKHESIMKEQIERSEGEVIKAEDAVRAEAQRQFREANALYSKLVEERDGLIDERDELRNEIKLFEDIAVREEKKAKAREVEVLAEVAQLRADLASVRAEMLAAQKRHDATLKESDGRVTELEAAVESSRVDCAAAHHSLATVVAEKERLEKENAELSAVCEELMGIVENGGGADSL